jgi:hypothetical protein
MEEQQHQLQQQAAELESRNRALEQASRYKSDFLANMSHELRTPLNSVILLAKMLALNDEGHLDAEEVKRATVIHQAGGELLLLINDILDLSKIEAGRMEVHPQPVVSAELLADFQRQFEDTARVKGLEFLGEDRWNGRFTTDRDRLGQIIRNLLSNAFKFTRQGRVVLSIVRRDDPTLPLAIAVTDTGIGIPQEQLETIFEAFRQADSSISRQFGGTGLGLSISLRIAHLLGGILTVASTAGVGSTFTVLLPETLTPGPAVPETSPPAAPLPLAVADDRDTLSVGDAVMLLIDNDPVFCAAVIQLNRQQGYKTLVAGTAAMGLHLAQRYRPSGILLDLGLPDMDGTELLKVLKSDRTLRSIPIYVVSARDRDPGLLQQGIVGYLQKPVDDHQLVAAEHEVLERATASRHLLVVEDAGLTADWVRQLLPEATVEVHAVTDGDAAIALCQVTPCSLALVGLGSSTDLARCAALCQALSERFPAMPLLIYSQRAISGEEEAALRRYTDSIVVQAPQAERRVLENIERFVREVRDRGKLPATPPAARENRLQGRHILVVDDDPRNLFVVTSALEREGAVVENALNGRKALEMLHQQPMDLVFMDIMMPAMNGYEAIAAIKADPTLRTIPVVALTAKAMKTDREEAIAAGADDYLAKPVDYALLINMAMLWCGRRT